MLKKRLISAAIVLSVIALLVWAELWLGSPETLGRPGLVLFGCCLVVGLMAASEMLYFNKDVASQIQHWPAMTGTAFVIVLAFVPVWWQAYPADCPIGHLGWILYGVVAALGLALISQILKYQPGNRVFDNVARTVLVPAYVGVLISFWSPIRALYDNEWGMLALLSLFVTVKLSDVMAFTIGKSFGKHRLAPNLSPGKTVEGLVGGLLGGCLGAVIVFYLFAPWLTGTSTAAPWWAVVIFGLVVAIVGVAGDLSVSLFKREGGVKDSSRWLPGLGGIMDMVDSVLPAGPVVYAFWATGSFGPVVT
ncbi:MAG: phosphatidate cytidylyltransferase [Pirellulaceae bacterium]